MAVALAVGASGTDKTPIADDLLYPVPAASDVIQGLGLEVLRYGYVNGDGQLVIPAQFSRAGFFSDGFAVVNTQFNRVESIDLDLQEPPSSKTLLINRRGEIVARHSYIAGFVAGLCVIGDCDGRKSCRWAVLDRELHETPLPVQSLGVLTFSEGLIPAILPTDRRDVITYIDVRGKPAFKVQGVQSAFAFSDGMARLVMADHQIAFARRHGDLLRLPDYQEAEDFHEGLALVRRHDSKYVFIDHQGKQAIAKEFTLALSFHEGLAWASQAPIDDPSHMKIGYIDHKGNWVIAPTLATPAADESGNFSEGMAVIGEHKESWQWTYMDRQGRQPIPQAFDHAAPFHKGLAFVEWRDDQNILYRGLINPSGKFIWKQKSTFLQ